MYDIKEYNALKLKYGSFSSWAIWNHADQSDATVIEKHIPELHSHFVLIGLNISGSLQPIPWLNFRGGRHDRKLKYACNDTVLRGSYITDLFKDLPEAKSSKLEALLSSEVISKNVSFFHNEMKDIKVTPDTTFVLLGRPNSLLARQFDVHFRKEYSNKVMYYYHYSYYRLTDEAWVNGLWGLLDLDYDFHKILQKYK